MAYRFRKHYTRDEARALLPQLRIWLKRLGELREEQQRHEQRLGSLMTAGQDMGGDLVNHSIRTLAEMQEILSELDRHQIFIKELDRGLVDFPAIIAGREVFLCWEQDEEDIEHWHDLDAGYAGREPL